jgi:hypothetical protein
VEPLCSPRARRSSNGKPKRSVSEKYAGLRKATRSLSRRRLTDAKLWADKARWAPDGKTIYFISNRDSAFFDVWGIAFDPVKGTTVGEEFRVTRFADPGRRLQSFAVSEFGVSRDRLVVPILERSGGVWVIDQVDR